MDRSKALAGPAIGKMLKTAAAARLGFLPVAALTGPVNGVISVLLGSVAAAAVGAAIFQATALVQAAGEKRRAGSVAGGVTVVGLLVLLLLPLLFGGGMGRGSPAGGHELALLLLPSGWPLAVVHGIVWPLWAAGGASLAGTAFIFFVLRRLRTSELTGSGSVSGHAAGAFYFGGFREMSRALDTGGTRRRFRLSGTRRASAFAVLVRADVVAFLRSVGKGRNIAVLALIPAAVGCTAGLGSAVVIAGVLLTCAWAAASISASVARSHAAVPVLDGLLPLTPFQTRRAHAVVPAVCLILWSLVAFGSLSAMGAGGLDLVVLGLLAGLGLAGAAIRAAFQPRPDWTAPGGSSSSIMMPAGVEASFLRGPDFAVLAMLPALVALVSGSAPWWLFLVQAGSSAFCLWWGTRPD